MAQVTITPQDLISKINEQAGKIASLELANAALDKALDTAEAKVVAQELTIKQLRDYVADDTAERVRPHVIEEF